MRASGCYIRRPSDATAQPSLASELNAIMGDVERVDIEATGSRRKRAEAGGNKRKAAEGSGSRSVTVGNRCFASPRNSGFTQGPGEPQQRPCRSIEPRNVLKPGHFTRLRAQL